MLVKYGMLHVALDEMLLAAVTIVTHTLLLCVFNNTIYTDQLINFSYVFGHVITRHAST